MSAQEIVIVLSGAVCLLGAWKLLTAPVLPVRVARWFTVGAAGGSIVATLLGWLLARSWAIEALGRGAVLAIVVGSGLGAIVLLRGRLRPRGSMQASRRYAKYANYRKVQP